MNTQNIDFWLRVFSREVKIFIKVSKTQKIHIQYKPKKSSVFITQFCGTHKQQPTEYKLKRSYTTNITCGSFQIDM